MTDYQIEYVIVESCGSDARSRSELIDEVQAACGGAAVRRVGRVLRDLVRRGEIELARHSFLAGYRLTNLGQVRYQVYSALRNARP